MVGELIADRYELEELIGTGGMSTVYRAHDRLLERDVALKVLHEHFVGDGDHVERFRSEARAVAQLSHPNIVTVIDRGEQEGRQFIVFELVSGENLKALVQREAPLPEREAIELALRVARALSFAHENGLVHRDVKPQNVLLGGDGEVKVTDFGIARALDVQRGLTQTGTVMGTSDYMAPEQARGAKASVQSDVYSLGAVLFELLTGDVPYHGDNFVAVAMRHINEPVPSVRERRPDVSPRLDAAVRRALAKDPRDRFPSMDVLAAELRGCLGETALNGSGPAAETAVIAPRREPARRPAPRQAERPTVWPLILLLAGLAVLAGVFAAVFAFTGSTPKSIIKDVVPGAGAKPKAVRLAGTSGYDPYGDQSEHDEAAGRATDGDRSTYWYTQTYGSPDLGGLKPGVGLLVDAGSARKLSKLTVTTDSDGGFTAQIKAGSSSAGPFSAVSGSQAVEGATTFSLHGAAARYYVIWITRLGPSDVAHVNEVTAKG